MVRNDAPMKTDADKLHTLLGILDHDVPSVPRNKPSAVSESVKVSLQAGQFQRVT